LNKLQYFIVTLVERSEIDIVNNKCENDSCYRNKNRKKILLNFPGFPSFSIFWRNLL